MQPPSNAPLARDSMQEPLEFSALAVLLRERFRDGARLIDFPGNAGDALIAGGTHQFLEAHGQSLAEHPISAPLPTGTLAIVSGGGNLVPYYDDVAEFLRQRTDRPGPTVLLPTTVRGHEALLQALPSTYLIACRDRESYRHCRTHARAAELALCPDMAFFWTRARHKVALRAALPRALATRPYAWRYLAKAVRAFSRTEARRQTGGRLAALRTDSEATARTLAPDNTDLSEVFRPRRVDRVSALLAVEALCRVIDPFEEVETNRLHIAVLAAHLGKRVLVSDNAYGKLRAVLELAPDHLLDRIEFVD